jgi:protein involved in polysaccharide export with SLBB domain
MINPYVFRTVDAVRCLICALGLLTAGAAPGQTLGGAGNGNNGRDPSALGAVPDMSSQQTQQGQQTQQQSGPPFRLRQPVTPALPARDRKPGEPLPPYQPGEFEVFVQRLAGPQSMVRRFGAELMTPSDQALDGESGAIVPADYLIKPGDEIVATLWGTVDADLRLVVDRSGRITIPRVGPVMVAGSRYADLPDMLSKRVSKVFRNTEVSVALGQLRGLRIYVTGFVARPGAYNVSSLATIVQALLEAGGPSAAGSMRDIELRRNKERISQLDLYELLMKGDRAADRVLQADDVIHVGAVGTQVALIGSVNRPAVFELRPGETVADVLRMGGGLTAVADRTRLAVERLDDRSSTLVTQLALPTATATQPANGDVLRAFSAVDVALPMQRQNKRVRVEGEVMRPGEYVLPPESSVSDALAAAGGYTTSAFPFGAEFSRESVRAAQQVNYERALRDLEIDMSRNTSTQRAINADEAAALNARDNANNRLIATLRRLKPNGRVVLQLPVESRELPPLALEDGDRLYIPPRPTAVGVFGSVFNSGSYLYGDGRMLGDFMRLAGGPTRGADAASTFVIRANGSVISARQQGSGGWFGNDSNTLAGVRAEPGDTLYVPEEIDKTSFVQHAKDWTQIFYQFGLGAAAIVALRR